MRLSVTLLSAAFIALSLSACSDSHSRGELALPQQGNPVPSSIVIGAATSVGHRALGGGLNYPGSVLFVNGKMLAADSSNHRVLLWNTIPTSTDTLADLVLGQPDLSSNVENNGGVSASSMSYPWGLASDGTHLVVIDSGNCRALVWNTFPTVSGQAADLVLGQPDFTSLGENSGGLSASSLSYAWGATISGGKLIIADEGNSRVLIWNAFPTVTGQAADFILGQPDASSNSAYQSVTSQSMSWPSAVAVSGTRLFVTDSNNQRVLVWNTFPTISGQAADLVLGQNTMTASAANGGATINSQAFNFPWGISTDGTRLFVADTGNDRVMVWNTLPTFNNQAADLVIGQADFVSNSYSDTRAVTGAVFKYPTEVATDGTHIAVSDSDGNRVLIWNSMPLSNNSTASVALGQPTMSSYLVNYSGGLSGSILTAPAGLYSDGIHFFVADTQNNRILIWNTVPSQDNTPADLVLGQPDMTSGSPNNGGISAISLNHPSAVTSDGTHLFVVDSDNDRVLIWNSIPVSNGQAADVVLGQPDMSSYGANNGGLSAKAVATPWGGIAVSPAGKLFLADSGNNRILIWNTIPILNFTSADVVVGQPNMVSRTANNGGISAATLYGPWGGIASDGDHLAVTDTFNHRILIWNSIPLFNGQGADLVLGQPDMTASTANNGGLGSRTLNYPSGVSIQGGRILAADTGNNRVLIWSTFPTAPFQAASKVYGQPDFISNNANYGGLSSRSLNGPVSVTSDGQHDFFADYGNDRALISPLN